MTTLAQSANQSLDSVRKGESNMIIGAVVIGAVLIVLFLVIRKSKR